jgi:hypothetical protein
VSIISKDKPCTVCHKRKNLQLFYASKLSKDGREYMCIECKKGRKNANYVAKPKRSPWRKQRSF